MNHMELARVRKDLIDDELSIPTSIGYMPIGEMEQLTFVCFPIQSYENDCTTESYDLLLKHPLTHELFWAYNIDFDFETIEGE